MRTLEELKKTMSDVPAAMEYDRLCIEHMVDTAAKHDKQDEILAAFANFIREGNDVEDSCLMAMTGVSG